MARVNGPIKVYNPSDTVPTDAEGGYAGGDSTAAAVGTAQAQALAAQQTIQNLAGTATTLPYGTNPTVSVSGSGTSKTINIGIPLGMPEDVGGTLVAAAQSAQAGAQASATLAGQAQAAALEVPDANVSALIGNPVTATANAVDSRVTQGLISPGLPKSMQSTATFTPNADDRKPAWMSADGLRIYNYQTTTLSVSTDGGITYTPIHTFPREVYGVREMPNGELLVSVLNDGGQPGTIQLSTGWAAGTGTATWAVVLTMSTDKAYAAGWYSFSPPLHHLDGIPPGTNMGIVLVTEYGTQGQGADMPRKVYASEDYGSAGSWYVVYDHAGKEIANHHQHGVAYDPWGDTVWVSWGDSTAVGVLEGGLAFSTDWRKGLSASWTDIETGEYQPVTIWPFPHCILMSTDRRINGLHRIDRIKGNTFDLELKTPYRINDKDYLTHFARTLYKRPGGPLLAAFATVGSDDIGRYGVVASTYDGYEFRELWRDPNLYTTTGPFGVLTALGPTAQGTMVGHLRDDSRSAPGSSTLITAPWNSDAEIPVPVSVKVVESSLREYVDINLPRFVDVVKSTGTGSVTTDGAWTTVAEATVTLPTGWSSMMVELSGWVSLRTLATTTTRRQLNYTVLGNGLGVPRDPTPVPYVSFPPTTEHLYDTVPLSGSFPSATDAAVKVQVRVNSTDKTNTGWAGVVVQARLTRLT